jgi:hypothetical protein
MALMADVGVPLLALRRQVASAIDLLVQTVRLPTGRRLVSHISEVAFDEKYNNYVISDVFTLTGEPAERTLSWTGAASELSADPSIESLADQIDLTKPIFEKTVGEPHPG